MKVSEERNRLTNWTLCFPCDVSTRDAHRCVLCVQPRWDENPAKQEDVFTIIKTGFAFVITGLGEEERFHSWAHCLNTVTMLGNITREGKVHS
jgi:hypothetical protein